jgi:hypothetical protein
VGALKRKPLPEAEEARLRTVLRKPEWEQTARPDRVCAGCGRTPVDDRDAAGWINVFAGFRLGKEEARESSWACSALCLGDAFRHFADDIEERLERLRPEAEELASDPVWQSFVNAPLGPSETEEQRQWSEEAELEEREIIERCARG